jgi:hypothetical protein
MTVLIGMTAITAGASAYAYRFGSRLLMNIALVGGLISPLLMQPATDQVFTLFLYLLVLNSAFFFLSIAKGWSELRIGSFIGTWIVYAAYFVHFNPSTEGIWSMPLRYALAAFVFYLIGFLLSSWRSNRCFDGWNLYLNLTNGVLFGSWSIYILQGELHYANVLALLGVCYLVSGAIVFRLTKQLHTASAAHDRRSAAAPAGFLASGQRPEREAAHQRVRMGRLCGGACGRRPSEKVGRGKSGFRNHMGDRRLLLVPRHLGCAQRRLVRHVHSVP